ncbi:hypothetical protein [Sphingomonas sp.]|uniref:hypothetical protein n=1 Tax=Sphingomonas sp. TaxID=28214 RepID=UPI0025FBCD2D|nr:hypothetical protein [Sphingomonas sp.]
MTKRLVPMFVLALSACSNGVNPPSLLPRPIEKQALATPPVAVSVTAGPIDPALQKQIVDALAKVKMGDAQFTRTDRASGRQIAAGRGAAEGSEAWVVGQQAQSALEAARQDSAGGLAEIAALLLAQTQAAASDPKLGGVAELTAAESEASTIVARQTERLQELTR